MGRTWPIGLLALALTGCAGKPEPLPKAYPVRGQVLFPDGRPMPDGLVQFRPAHDTPYTITGRIQADGAFTLETRLSDGRKVAGAPEGTYRVTVVPPSSADQSTLPVELPRAHTVQPQDGNEFRFTVAQPANQ
jgi:hypothetical protein